MRIYKLIGKVCAIIGSLMIVYTFFEQGIIFYTIGSIGGGIFLMKMFMEAGFPKQFKD